VRINYFSSCEDKLLFKAKLRVVGVGQQIIMNEETNFKVLKAHNTVIMGIWGAMPPGKFLNL